MVDFEIKVTPGTAQQFADEWDEERGVSQMGKQTFEVLRHVGGENSQRKPTPLLWVSGVCRGRCLRRRQLFGLDKA
jgi:hypothetical protein